MISWREQHPFVSQGVGNKVLMVDYFTAETLTKQVKALLDTKIPVWYIPVRHNEPLIEPVLRAPPWGTVDFKTFVELGTPAAIHPPPASENSPEV